MLQLTFLVMDWAHVAMSSAGPHLSTHIEYTNKKATQFHNLKYTTHSKATILIKKSREDSMKKGQGQPNISIQKRRTQHTYSEHLTHIFLRVGLCECICCGVKFGIMLLPPR